MSDRTALYRHWDIDGNLLYVGISLSAVHRLSQHKRASHWHDDIANMTIEWFDTRRAALEAERDAIRMERPRYNKTYNAANDNQPEPISVTVDGWTVYVVRNMKTGAFEGVFWASNLAELWDIVDEDFDPSGFEFAELQYAGGLTAGSAAGAKIQQTDDDIPLEGYRPIPWRRFNATELFENELRDQDGLDWTPFCAADEQYGLIARVFSEHAVAAKAA